MIWMVLVGAVLLASLVGGISHLVRRRDQRQLEAMFRKYNTCNDALVIIDWISEKKTEKRLLQTLEFLAKIEADELAQTVYQAFPFDAYPNRHLRIHACRIFDRMGEGERACQLAQRLLDSHPSDDSILALYVETHLNHDHVEEAKRRLLPRLAYKFDGTDFKRLHARILAAEGQLDEAITIMHDVIKKEYVRHRNTVAPLDKRLIYEQFKRSEAFLDSLLALREGNASPITDKAAASQGKLAHDPDSAEP